MLLIVIFPFQIGTTGTYKVRIYEDFEVAPKSSEETLEVQVPSVDFSSQNRYHWYSSPYPPEGAASAVNKKKTETPIDIIR